MVAKNEGYDPIVPRFEERPAPVAWDWVKNQHIKQLHPKYWLELARSLRDSADIIFEHERPFAEILHDVLTSQLDRSHLKRLPNLAGAHLLYAFAFENLLKGIIIAKNSDIRDPTLWGTTPEEEKSLKELRIKKGLHEWMSHDTKKLYQLARISIPEPYLRLLWLFEGKAVWSCRYPTALSAPQRVRRDSDGLSGLYSMA